MKIENLTPRNISVVKEWIADNRDDIPVEVLVALRVVAPLTVDEYGWKPVYHLQSALDQVDNKVIMLDELEDGRIAALNGVRIAFYNPGDLRPDGEFYRLETGTVYLRDGETITTVEEYENLPDGSIIAHKRDHGGTTVAIKTEDDVWEMSSYCEMADNQAIAELFTNGAQVIRDGDA